MLGWKTCGHYHETDEFPNPRPTQPKANPTREKLGLKWNLSHYFPQQIIFLELGLILYGKQTTRNRTQQTSPQTPYCWLIEVPALTPRDGHTEAPWNIWLCPLWPGRGFIPGLLPPLLIRSTTGARSDRTCGYLAETVTVRLLYGCGNGNGNGNGCIYGHAA